MFFLIMPLMVFAPALGSVLIAGASGISMVKFNFNGATVTLNYFSTNGESNFESIFTLITNISSAI